MDGLTLTGLEGKVAVVTGAGRMRSIGRPIAVELARAGCDVVLTGTGRSPDRYPDDEKAAGWRDIDSVAEEVRALGRRALPMVSDVSDLAAVEALAGRVVAELGSVDIVINNAGAARGADRVPVVELAPDVWRNVINVNLNGTFYMSHTFGQLLVKQGKGGSIVNISSIGGKWMAARTAAYAASKAGIHALTAAMSGEVGPSRCAGERHLPRDHRHLPNGRHPPGAGLAGSDRQQRSARAGGKRRGHRLDGRVPVLRPRLVDHRTAVHDRRWDAARSMTV